MVYLLGITWLAFCYGRRTAIAGTLFSVAFFDFFFVPPFYTFAMMDPGHYVTFGVMLIVSFIIGSLTGRLRRQTAAMRRREERTQVLYALSRDLAKSSRPEELFQILLAHIQDFFKYPAVIFAENVDKKLDILTAVLNGRELADREKETANWTYQHRQAAGKSTDTLSGSQGFYMPLIGAQEVVGTLGIYPGDNQDFLSPENYHILEIFVKQTASAVEGAVLAAANIKAEAELETTRLRNMILDTSAYDFKKSLVTISRCASDLSNPEISANVEKKNNLIKEIQTETKQLNDLIDELPKIIDELKG
jgi:two-component system sensor histidine kinase KdpD